MSRQSIFFVLLFSFILPFGRQDAQDFPSRFRMPQRKKICCVLYTNEPGNFNYFRRRTSIAKVLRDSFGYRSIGIPSSSININQIDSFEKMKDILREAINTDIIFILKGTIGSIVNTNTPNGRTEEFFLELNVDGTPITKIADFEFEELILSVSSRNCKFTFITLACNASGSTDELRTRANFPFQNICQFRQVKEPPSDTSIVCLLHIFNTYVDEPAGGSEPEMNTIGKMISDARGSIKKMPSMLSTYYQKGLSPKIYFKLHTENTIF